MHHCCRCSFNVICITVTNLFSQHTKYYFLSLYYKSGTFWLRSTLAALYTANCMRYAGYNPLITTTSSTSGAIFAFIATRSIWSKNFDTLSSSPLLHGWEFHLNLAWTLALVGQKHRFQCGVICEVTFVTNCYATLLQHYSSKLRTFLKSILLTPPYVNANYSSN